MKLVIKIPFADFKVGEEITHPDLVALHYNSPYVTRVATPYVREDSVIAKKIDAIAALPPVAPVVIPVAESEK